MNGRQQPMVVIWSEVWQHLCLRLELKIGQVKYFRTTTVTLSQKQINKEKSMKIITNE